MPLSFCRSAWGRLRSIACDIKYEISILMCCREEKQDSGREGGRSGIPPWTEDIETWLIIRFDTFPAWTPKKERHDRLVLVTLFILFCISDIKHFILFDQYLKSSLLCLLYIVDGVYIVPCGESGVGIYPRDQHGPMNIQDQHKLKSLPEYYFHFLNISPG